MAVYFLERSQTYRAKSSREVYRRREIVAKHLKDDYKAGKFREQQVFEAAKKELTREGIELTFKHFRSDKLILRNAFLFLKASDEAERKKIRTKSSVTGGSFGINCLVKDGIFTWEQLMSEKVAAPTPPKAVVLPVIPSEASPSARVRGRLADILDDMEQMLTENDELRRQAERFAEEKRGLEGQLADDQAYIQLAEAELEALQKLLDSARGNIKIAHGRTLEQIALENPEFPDLLKIAQQLRDTPGRKRKRLEELRRLLPATFKWQNDEGQFTYQEPFLRALGDLTEDERNQSLKQLENFAKYGPEYAALNTKKSGVRKPYTPLEHFTSRGAAELRFTWTKNGGVTVHWLYRRGDSRVRYAEA